MDDDQQPKPVVMTRAEFLAHMKASFQDVLKMTDAERDELSRIRDEQGFSAAKAYMAQLREQMQAESRVPQDPGFRAFLSQEEKPSDH